MEGKETLHLVLDKDTIAKRITEMAQEVEAWRQGEPLVAVCVLKGAFLFFSDLVRQLAEPMNVEFMRASSYGSGTSTSGQVQILEQKQINVEGKRVLLVEDIVDTGLSMQVLHNALMLQNPKALAVCSLISKHERRAHDIKIDFEGFNIEQGFLVGFGMDYAERYRELPAIYELVFS